MGRKSLRLQCQPVGSPVGSPTPHGKRPPAVIGWDQPGRNELNAQAGGIQRGRSWAAGHALLGGDLSGAFQGHARPLVAGG